MIASRWLPHLARPVPRSCVSRWAPKRTSVAMACKYSRPLGKPNVRVVCTSIERRHSQPRPVQQHHDPAFLHRRRANSTASKSHLSDVKTDIKTARETTKSEPPPPQSNTKPPYKPPTTGLVSRLPKALIPFAELSRLSAPAGMYYLLAPCLFSTLLAASALPVPASPTSVITTTLLFTAGATIMRGAGCTINDLWDRNLDGKVARTRLRPLARGAVSPTAAAAWFGAQCLAGLAVLVHFPPQAVAAAVPSLILVACYPLAKRVTSYPQFVLGLTFSWGALLGPAALAGVDLFPRITETLVAHVPAFLYAPVDVETAAMVSAAVSMEGLLPATALLYASCVLWTLVYDTIYAFQDIADDARAGIKSSALAQSRAPKRFLAVLAAAQVGLLGGVGVAMGFGPAYFVGTCGGAAATLGTMIWRVRVGDVADCARWFRRGAWFTGFGIGLGFLAEWIVRLVGVEGEEEVEEDAESLAAAGQVR